MKIKKSDLTHLIESYINEQMSVSVGTDGGVHLVIDIQNMRQQQIKSNSTI